MNVLVVYCHPRPESFTAAVHNTAVETVKAMRHSVEVIELYAERFDPVMSTGARPGYQNEGPNLELVREHARRLM